MTNKKQKIDIDKINIFSSPRFLKVWSNEFSQACGSDTFNVAPNMVKLRFLMEKFVTDYNKNLEELDQDNHVKDYEAIEKAKEEEE